MKLHEYHVKIHLPEELQPLQTIAYNLWWSWNSDARELFRTINPQLWETSGHNPVAVLSSMDTKKFRQLAGDPVFMSRLDEVWRSLVDYLKLPRWFETTYRNYLDEDFCVAYFSAEYGLHESVQLYSGGLGILSGDHCKAAADLGIPFVAVGLLYRNGYFHQYLNSDGWQQEYYPYNEFYKMPINPLVDDDGNDVYLSVELGGRTVKVRVWELTVGTIRILLLDTDLAENDPADRAITGKLYGGDTVMRIRQEVILGVAGVRALRAAKVKPTVYHLNEGHPAFSTFERIREFVVDSGLDIRAAAEVVKKSTLFTTHTPVPAGFDVFGKDLVETYLGPIFAKCGLHVNQLMGFGRVNPFDENEPFSMAVCGMRLSTYRNGVSALHGAVSRDMFQSIWPNALKEYVPVGHVTNGVHLPTFIGDEFKTLYTRYLGENWSEKPYDFSVWDHVDNIPDPAFFATKQRLRERLVSFTRQRLRNQLRSRGASAAEAVKADEVLNPNVLTIGFARRFATYKRAYLLFMDEARLSKIVNNPDRPVQFIIAGKAHPKDNGGKEIIKKITHIARKPEFRSKIVFLEDYDIEVARHLAQGVDVWLNTPRRPMEASGTSGMKIAANGGLNFSILDGWWNEAYDGENGWAIGYGEDYEDTEYQDFVESMELYDKLENEIVPTFYAKDKTGIPREWVRMMKHAITTCASFFNTSRMVMNYTEQFYLPLHTLSKVFNREGYDEAKKFVPWRDELISSWDSVGFDRTAATSSSFSMDDSLKLEASIRANGIPSEHLAVYAVLQFDGTGTTFTDPEFIKLDFIGEEEGAFRFERSIGLNRSGKLQIAFAAVPTHQYTRNIFELNLITWAEK